MKIVSNDSTTVVKQNYLSHDQNVSICMLSLKTENSVGISLYDGMDPEWEEFKGELEAPYIISVGVAIQKDGDTYNKELGEKIAYNRALNPTKAFMVFAQTKGGIFDEITRKVILDRIASKDLSYFSISYEKAENKYFEEQGKKIEVEALIEVLTPEEKKVLNDLQSLSDESINKLIDITCQGK